MENPAREQIGQKDEGTFSGFRQARKGQTYFFGTTKQIFKILAMGLDLCPFPYMAHF